MALMKMPCAVGTGSGIYYKEFASVPSDTVNVGFEPSQIYVSYTHPDNLPMFSVYSKDLYPSGSVAAYTRNGTTSSLVQAFSQIPSSTAMISAVSSTGFTINLLSQCSNITIVAIP